MRFLLIGFACLFIAACAAVNPYEKYYRGETNARSNPEYIVSTEPIRIIPTNNLEQDGKKLMAKGYAPIGKSAFNAGENSVSTQQVLDVATIVGAQIVLTASEYTNTESGAVPILIPNVSTSYSSGTATAYGAGGSATAYGSGTTTTYGNKAVYMPYSIRRSDFVAFYFAKTKVKVGLYVEPLDDSLKKKIQRNNGVRVYVVIEDSPAFEANVLPDDILLSVNGTPIKSIEHFQEILTQLPYGLSQFEIYRDGKILRKNLKINS